MIGECNGCMYTLFLQAATLQLGMIRYVCFFILRFRENIF